MDLRTTRRWLLPLTALLMLGIAAYLRLWQLGAVPAFFHFDEGNNGADALRVLAGEHALFFGANRGREGLIVYGVAAFTALLGRSMLAARLTGALASTLAVVALFWLGSILFAPRGDRTADDHGGATRWRGLAIGALGAGMWLFDHEPPGTTSRLELTPVIGRDGSGAMIRGAF